MWKKGTVIKTFVLMILIFAIAFIYVINKDNTKEYMGVQETRAQLHTHSLMSASQLHIALAQANRKDEFIKRVRSAATWIQGLRSWLDYTNVITDSNNLSPYGFDKNGLKSYQEVVDHIDISSLVNINSNREDNVEQVQTVYENIIELANESYFHDRRKFESLLDKHLKNVIK